MQSGRALVIFARSATPGTAKTRLAPALGLRGAADFQSALMADTVRKVMTLKRSVSPYFFLAGQNFPTSPSISRFTLQRQRGADLGERLERAFRRLLRRHGHAVVIGTDSPALPPRVLRQAFIELRFCDAVLGPCPDGGFYLIGLRRLAKDHELLQGVRWGSAFAFRDTLRSMLRQNFSCSVLRAIEDVDRPEDIMRLKKRLARDRAARRLSPAVWRFLNKKEG